MTTDRTDPFALVESELRAPLEFVLGLVPPDDGASPEEAILRARERGRMLAKPFLPSPSVSSWTIPGPAGAPEIELYVVNSDPAIVRPAVLHMHGGGFVAGSARGSVADLQIQALALDCVIVTVEYRLAPETPFPGALEDNYASLRWLHAHAEELGVDAERIAIQGESAGGGHAAMLALAARDRGDAPILFQALLQPMLDDRTASSVEVPAHLGAFLWRPDLNVGGWTALLGRAPGGEATPAGAAPSRAASLAGLPPTFIAVGSIDLFAPEDVEFARRLLLAGVPTELLLVSGGFHGFDVVAPDGAIGRRYRLALLNALARAFGRPELTEAPTAAAWSFATPVDAA